MDSSSAIFLEDYTPGETVLTISDRNSLPNRPNYCQRIGIMKVLLTIMVIVLAGMLAACHSSAPREKPKSLSPLSCDLPLMELHDMEMNMIKDISRISPETLNCPPGLSTVARVFLFCGFLADNNGCYVKPSYQPSAISASVETFVRHLNSSTCREPALAPHRQGCPRSILTRLETIGRQSFIPWSDLDDIIAQLELFETTRPSCGLGATVHLNLINNLVLPSSHNILDALRCTGATTGCLEKLTNTCKSSMSLLLDRSAPGLIEDHMGSQPGGIGWCTSPPGPSDLLVPLNPDQHPVP